MHTSALFSSIPMLLLLLTFVSCKKETPEPEYPATLTIENCEAFVEAPQEIVDALIQEERDALAANNPYGVIPPEVVYYDPLASVTLDSGQVLAYDGDWRNIEYVRVTGNNFWTHTTGAVEGTNYRMSRSYVGGKTLTVNTDYLNGVSAVDRLLIMRHVAGIQPFTTYMQMCAADVDGNDLVDSNDADLIQKAHVGLINEFPAGNVRFVPEAIFYNREADWINEGIFDNYTFQGSASSANYLGIKVGDVNATFKF